MNTKHLRLVKIVKQAAELQRKLFFKRHRTSFKDAAKSQIVGEVDIETERVIRQGIKQLFPQDGILGEEMGIQEGTSGRTWIIDPLDGSQNFYHHIPKFGISVALQDQKGIAFSIVAHSMIDEFYVAERGGGAWLGGKKINVSSIRALGNAAGHLIAVSSALAPRIRVRALNQLISHEPRRVWVSESTVISSVEVAVGYVDFCVALRCSVWDAAATSLLITESGGIVTNLRGAAWDADLKQSPFAKLGVIFSNRYLHRQLLQDFNKFAFKG